ncbi:MAG TPA: alcohol dehydrogenase catalytic domain-containing protein [Thermoanaerobaculia bacterium]|jgi:L-iditol 2-dehydrogenase|nr:alcohol dehydrogenase catalytic domain-containing protein [Thermoanaerobaculia bacterium]
MKAFVQTAIGRFESRDIAPPRPGPGEVVLRVRAALTCGTDRKLLERGHPKIALPVTMGHEACGEVAELGEGVVGVRLGERVVPGVSGPCGVCSDCRGGRANLCASGHADRTWGAFAEFLRVPAGVVASNLHRPPADLPDEVAAFLDPLASVLHGWKRLSVAEGRLLIYGSGALALLWAATARSHGMQAIVAGRKPERLNLAASCGADVLDLERYEPEDLFSRTGALPDAAVDCTGDPQVWMRLPNLVRHGGTVLLFGGCAPGASATFDAARLHYCEISLVGSFHYTPEEAREAMRVLASGEVDPRPLITDAGKLSDLPRFLDALRRGEGIRYAVRP